MFKRGIVVLCLLGALSRLYAAEPEKVIPPAGAVTAVGEHWGVVKLEQRLTDADRVWQQDVYWELLRICEKDEKARADVDVQTVLSWLLIERGLWTAETLSDSVYSKIPVMMPALGRRIMAKRVETWIRTAGSRATGMEPWTWPEFRTLDRTLLLAALQDYRQGAPLHDPAVVLWLAAARMACDDPEAAQEFAAARAQVKLDLPLKGQPLIDLVMASLVQSGVRGVLPLMLDDEIAAAENTDAEPENGAQRFNGRQDIFQLLGWNVAQKNKKAELAKLRGWMKEHSRDLEWDPARRMFISNAPPPGMEKSYAFAKNVEKKFNLRCTKQFLAHTDANGSYRGDNGQLAGLIPQLVNLMVVNKEAAADADVTGLLREMLAQQDTQTMMFSTTKDTLLNLLPRANPELATEWVAGIISKAFADNAETDPLFQQFLGKHQALTEQACQRLIPQYDQLWQAAQKGGDAEKALNLAMQLNFLGGRPDRKAVVELLMKAPVTWYGSEDAPLNRWTWRTFNARRKGYLRMLLIRAAFQLANPGFRPNDNSHMLGSFIYTCGWSWSTDIKGKIEDKLAECETWFDQNETILTYDEKKNRWMGGVPPDKAPLAAALKAIPAKYRIPIDDALGPDDNAARNLLHTLLTLVMTNKEAAGEHSIHDSIVALLGSPQDNDINQLIVLPKASRELAVRIFALLLDKDLDSFLKGSFNFSQMQWAAHLERADAAAVAESRAVLAPKYKTLAAATDTDTDQHLRRTLALLYLGGAMTPEELEKALTEAANEAFMFYDAGLTVTKTGNIAGLRILLKAIETGEVKGFGAFELLSGMSDQHIQPPQNLGDRLKSDKNWLDANAGNLKWDTKVQHFVVQNTPERPPKAPNDF